MVASMQSTQSQKAIHIIWLENNFKGYVPVGNYTFYVSSSGNTIVNEYYLFAEFPVTDEDNIN
jgi:VanZ family protein